jgi:hypothetical protein
MRPNDPSSAIRPMGRADCKRSVMALLDICHRTIHTVQRPQNKAFTPKATSRSPGTFGDQLRLSRLSQGYTRHSLRATHDTKSPVNSVFRYRRLGFGNKTLSAKWRCSCPSRSIPEHCTTGQLSQDPMQDFRRWQCWEFAVGRIDEKTTSVNRNPKARGVVLFESKVLQARVGIGPDRKVRSVKIVAKRQCYSSILCDYSSILLVCFSLTVDDPLSRFRDSACFVRLATSLGA